VGDPFCELDRAIAAAGPVERAQLIVAIAARLASLAAPATIAPARWITPEAAAELAQVPATRVRKWARRADAAWAHYPTRQLLRVDAEAFDSWLSMRLRARDGASRPLKAVATGASGRLQAATGGRST
jgi:hypothetical protein